MRRVRPATDRIIKRLPGPPVAWIGAWALVPWLNAGANLLIDEDSRSAVWDESTTAIVLSYAALSAAVVITLCGGKRLGRRLELLEPAADDRDSRRNFFCAANSVAGPCIGAAVMALAFVSTTLVNDGLGPAILRGATWFVIGIPIWSFLWTYGALQLGLHRLGDERLVGDPGNVAPDLGLRPLGDAAFTGLWLMLAWLVPVVWTGLPDVVGFVIGMLALVACISIFFLPLVRLHHQMVAAKRRELELARRLYAEAYEPVRREQNLDALERQRSLLGAADALEKRAAAIHEWPIDEGTLARVITIATSVVAITIGRLLLDPFGL